MEMEIYFFRDTSPQCLSKPLCETGGGGGGGGGGGEDSLLLKNGKSGWVLTSFVSKNRLKALFLKTTG